jgi:hypothetical protein
MLKIWIVITVLGHVSETIGPVPYEMSECRLRVAEKMQSIHAKFLAGLILPPLNGKRLTEEDVKMTCLEAYDRPVLDSVFP